MTPDEFYDRYRKASDEGDVEELYRLHDLAEEDDELEAALLEAIQEEVEEFNEWYERGGKHVLEQEERMRQAMYKQKIRSKEVPPSKVIHRLARTASSIARLMEYMPNNVTPVWERLMEQVDNVRLAHETYVESDE